MAQAVVTLGGVLVFVDLEGGRGKGIDHQGDDAGGIGLKRELRHREHEIELFKDELLVLNIGWLRQGGDWLRFQFPLAGGEQTLLDLAHGGEVLIETRTIIAAEIATEFLRVIHQRVENAAAFVEGIELSLHGLGITLEEHATEQGRGAVLGRQQHAVAGPGETTVRLVDVHAEVQRRKTRELTKLLHCILVERDLVAKPALGRSTGGGEKTVLRAVSAVHIGVRHAAVDAELVPHLGQRCQGWRQFIIASGIFGEERLRKKSEVVGNDEHPARCLQLLRRPAEHWRHAFEQR
ncbi:MAG: hypothetical protein RL693_872 [Verrucomicrobiota bacterium]